MIGTMVRGLRQDYSAALRMILRSFSAPAGVAVLLVASGFILLHCIAIWTSWGNQKYRLDLEGSYPEIWEFVLLLSAALLHLFKYMKNKRFPALYIAVILIYLALDDAFALHESGSKLLMPGHQHRGELLYMLIIASLIMACALHCFFRATQEERPQLLAIGMIFAVLGAVAIGVDAAHAVLGRLMPFTNQPLALLEDGTELIAITALFTISCALAGISMKWTRLFPHRQKPPFQPL